MSNTLSSELLVDSRAQFGSQIRQALRTQVNAEAETVREQRWHDEGFGSEEALERIRLRKAEAERRLAEPIEATRVVGGELATHLKEIEQTRPDVFEALTSGPTALEVIASKERVDALAFVGTAATVLGIDLAESASAQTSLEKALAHQMATAHTLALSFASHAQHELGFAMATPARNAEAARAANASARMMAAFSAGALALERIQSARRAGSAPEPVQVIIRIEEKPK